MAITTHFIDETWKLQSRIIRFIYVSCTYTAEVLCEILVDCLMDWFIDQGSLVHMQCCAHILNLIVRDGLDVIGDGIENNHSSVAFWVATPKRCERFEETASLLKVSFSKKLVLDCKTRWNSTYKMLKVVICYKDVFTRLKQREPLYKSAPKEEEWVIAREICDKLKSIIERMTMRMLDKFEKYCFQINGIMGVTTVLDPRYKLRLLHFYFPLIYTNDEDAKKEIEMIQGICYNFLNEYSLKSKASEVGASCQSSASSVTSHDEIDPMSNYDKFVAFDSEGNLKNELDSC
ncbi:hypothetical protein ACS0TY_006378 [Phlomoides rotata]